MRLFLLITLLTLELLMRFHGITLAITGAQSPSNKAQIRELKQKLQEPAPAENQPAARDALARQQAEAAIALMKLGQEGQVWLLLRHSSDDSRRTYLIHSLAGSGVNAAIIIRRLETEKDVSVQRALILSLGEFTGEQLPQSLRGSLIPKLLRWYRDDPDPGIHAAVEWVAEIRQARRPTTQVGLGTGKCA